MQNRNKTIDNNNNQKGSVLIVTLLVISALLIQITGLTKVLLLYNKTSLLQYNQLKAYYLAESGFALANSHFESIPAVPPTPSKDEIVKLIPTSKTFTANLEGEIHLLKNTSSIFSIGTVDTKYKSIIKRNYTTSGNIIILGDWEQIY
jgi:hypothetical protein